MRSQGYPLISEKRFADAARLSLKTQDARLIMEEAAADYIEHGLPDHDPPDWTVIFENALI